MEKKVFVAYASRYGSTLEVAEKIVERLRQAGWRTPFVWVFAHLFYRHRQRRWKRYLERE